MAKTQAAIKITRVLTLCRIAKAIAMPTYYTTHTDMYTMDLFHNVCMYKVAICVCVFTLVFLPPYVLLSDLDLTFTQTLSCPWTCQTVDVAIKEGGRTCRVTEENKVLISSLFHFVSFQIPLHVIHALHIMWHWEYSYIVSVLHS